MVSVPIPHPNQSSQPYRVRFQESYADPFAQREYAYVPQVPQFTAAPTSEPAPVQQPTQNQAEVSAAVASVSASAQAVAAALKEQDWINLLAAGTLIAGGALLVSGHKRTGLIVAAAGTAMALIEEKESIEMLWKKLPDYLKEAQSLLDKAEGYMNDVSTSGQKLHGVFR